MPRTKQTARGSTARQAYVPIHTRASRVFKTPFNSTPARSLGLPSAANRRDRTYKAAEPSVIVATGPTIKIIVGSSKQEFTIHELLAKAYSEYFKTALSGQWQEAQQRTFELAGENVSIFAGFVHYLYSLKVKLNRSAPDDDVELFLIESYTLGERRGCMSFRDAVLDELHSFYSHGKHPSVEAIMVAFSESRENSTLLRYIADKCAWEADSPARTAIREGDLEESTAPYFRDELLKALFLRDEALVSDPFRSAPYDDTQFQLEYHERLDVLGNDGSVRTQPKMGVQWGQ